MAAEQGPGQVEREQAAHAWASLEKLFAPESQVSVREGWVEPNFNLARAYTHTPRRQSTIPIVNAVQRALGNTERYEQTARSIVLGKMPEEQGYLTYTYGKRAMPPRLVAFDNVYRPLNPVDAQTNAIRHIQVLFRTHTSADWYGKIYEDGLTFDLLGVGLGDNPIPTTVHVGYYNAGISPVVQENRYTKQFLTEHNSPRPYTRDIHSSAASLLDVCIAEATNRQS